MCRDSLSNSENVFSITTMVGAIGFDQVPSLCEETKDFFLYVKRVKASLANRTYLRIKSRLVGIQREV